MSLRTWSTTASSNTLVESVSIAEGCAPGNLNDAIRTVMADVAQWRALLEGAKTSAGTANAQTLTTGMSVASNATPLLFAFKAGAGLTNSTAMTMAVDGLSALDVKLTDGSALIGGEVVAGGVYILVYEATAQVFMLLTPTVTLSAFARTIIDDTSAGAMLTTLGGTAAGQSMFTAASATAQTALLNVFGGDVGAGGVKGLAPATVAGDALKYLKGDGTWGSPSGTGAPADATYYTTSSNSTLSAEVVVPAYIQTLLDDVDAATARTTLGFASGTYTPSITNGTNVAASTAYACQYLRVGNVVTVSGRVDIDPTTTVNTDFTLSLPVASNLAAATGEDCAGSGSRGPGTSSALESFSISGDSTNNVASFLGRVNDAANRGLFFTFTYLVI